MIKAYLEGITKEELISAMKDLYGYSSSDFSQLSVAQIYSTLSNDQILEIEAYYA